MINKITHTHTPNDTGDKDADIFEFIGESTNPVTKERQTCASEAFPLTWLRLSLKAIDTPWIFSEFIV